ncbi:MAG: TonB-dependent receptor [Bacteroidales bacterium]|nr:TonB-dependent receptor [Bacteroidales bacterium]
MEYKNSALRHMLLCILLCLCRLPLWSQDAVIRGTIVDASGGEPVIGAYISLGGSSGHGCMTDLDGRYELALPVSTKDDAVLTVICVGYEDTEVSFGTLRRNGRIAINVKSELIEEIVVVGYGTQKKTSSVGSIAQANGSELQKSGNVNSVSEALQGRLNGVIAFNTTGQPGDNSASIYIRGKSSWQNTSPLVLVDGIERDMNDVDFNEIESISVLKDASATAVYGVRGGNGVILLTTKRGTEEKPRINFSMNIGLKSPTTKSDWADYVTSMKMYNEAMANEGNWNGLISQETIDAWEHAFATGNYGPYNDVFPHVDWNEEILQTAVSHSYNVNINGKAKAMRYFASVGYQHDGSIYNIEKAEDYDPRAYFDRLNWRANFDFNITKTTTFSVNVAGKMGYRNSQYYADVYGFLTVAPSNSFPIRYSDGYWGDATNQGVNPIADMSAGGQIRHKSFQGWYDAKLVQDFRFITEGLKAHASISYSSASVNRDRVRTGGIFGGSDFSQMNAFPREYRIYDYTSPVYGDDGTVSYPYTAGYHGNRYYTTPPGTDFDTTTSLSRKLFYEFGISYARKFNGHDVSAMALMNRQITETSGGSTFAFPAYREDWVARVTYNWKERYLFEANASYTGSEKFAPGMRFGFFPSFSVGWRITEEPWMKWSRKVLTNMKVRYSCGKVGTDIGAGRFQYIQLYDQNGTVNFGKDENTAFGPTYIEGSIAQPHATWETSVKQNLGIEIGLWKRLKIALDLFDEKRDGILLSPRTTAAWVGASISAANLGKTKNHGLELEVNWSDRVGTSFSYFVNFAFAASENRIVFRDDPNNFLDYQKDAGKPINWQTRYVVSGNYETIDDIFNSATLNSAAASTIIPGDLAYIDYNGDGVVDSNDQVVTKNLNYPLSTYTLTLGFDWKGLSFSMMFYSPQGVYKNYINAYLWDFPSGYVKAQPNTLDRWTYETAGTAGVQRPAIHVNNTANNTVPSTYRFTDYSYIRLKNVELSYTLPKRWRKAAQMANCSVYVSGNNLFTWWKGDKRIDPETSNSDGTVNETANIYPILRTYTIGLRLGF